jgi:ADP-ribose pyrophosphatase YjhB (NUDIX family)
MTKATRTAGRRLGVGTRVLRILAWTLKAKYTHGAATIVVAAGSPDQVLLVRQRFRERNCWGLPGGFLNVGEPPEAGARRELHEETGVGVDELVFELVDSYKQPWAWHWEHLYVTTAPRDGPRAFARSAEINSVDWHSVSDLPRLTVAAQEALQRWTDGRPDRGDSRLEAETASAGAAETATP